MSAKDYIWVMNIREDAQEPQDYVFFSDTVKTDDTTSKKEYTQEVDSVIDFFIRQYGYTPAIVFVQGNKVKVPVYPKFEVSIE